MRSTTRSVLAALGAVGAMMVWTPPVEATNSIASVDSGGSNVGEFTSLAFDAAGNPVISYYDRSNGDLKLSHCNDANCAGGDESIVAVDRTGNVGRTTSLMLDAAGNPVISYFDDTNGDPKLAHCNDANCAGGDESIVALDRAGVVGWFTSLVLDAAGNPVVSYFDVTNGDLKVAHCNDADCAGGDESIVALDRAGTDGMYTSLELDAAGSPVVSYFDVTNGDLKVAHCNDANCAGGDESIVAVDRAGVVGGDTSLELDAAGNPVVSYFDDTNDDLRLVRCDDANCAGGGERFVTVDSAGVVGWFTSLVLDAAGNPVVSYFDATNDDLKVAHCNDTDCADGDESVIAVDSTGNVGAYTSLVLDAAGNPVVSYFLGSNWDLKLAHCDNAICAPESCNGLAATIVGTAGDDHLLDTDGADVIAALDGDDTISGLAGDDVICGGTGDDVLDGGPGDDRLVGEGGVDTVIFLSAPAGVSASLTTSTAIGDGADQLLGIEGLVGSQLDDVLVGDAGANTIIGVFGDDTLDGSGGDDVVVGHHGDDLIVGGAGDDALDGDLGFDTVSFAASAAAVDADLSSGTAAGEGTDRLAGIEGLTGSPFDDVLVGDAGDNAIHAGAGSDTLDGLAGDDNAAGDDGADTVNGGAGDDSIDGGAGDDRLDGDDGIDTANYSASVVGVAVSLTAGTSTGHGRDVLVDVDNLVGSPFSDVLTGNAGANVMRGGNGNDSLAGGGGNDGLDGGVGVDTVSFAASPVPVTANLSTGRAVGEGADVLVAIDGVVGSRFSDVLTGNAGANVMRGGNGNDSLAGGGGNDGLDGGVGVDTVSFAASPAPVTANLSTRRATGEGADVLVAIDGVVGSRFSDVLTGNAGANVMRGGNGNDALAGRGGNDQISGQVGNDVLKGRGGNDALNGGANFDRGNGGAGSDTQVRCEVVVQIP